MDTLNFLPWRARRRRQRRLWMLSLLFLAVAQALCLLVLLAVPAWSALGFLQEENRRLQALREELAGKAIDMQALDASRQRLNQQRDAVEALQLRRLSLSRLLPAVVGSLPETILLRRLSMQDGRLELQGQSRSAADVSLFQGRLGEQVGAMHLALLQSRASDGLQFRLQGQVDGWSASGGRP